METSAAAIKTCTDFHVKWLAQLGKDFGAERGDQSAILRIVASVKFRWDGEFDSNAAFQLMQAPNLALPGVDKKRKRRAASPFYLESGGSLLQISFFR